MREVLAAMALLVAMAAPCAPQEVSGDREVAAGSHGVLEVAGAPEGASACSWFPLKKGVTIRSFEGGLKATWSALPGDYEIKLTYINWDERILYEESVAVRVAGSVPPTPGPGPDNPEPPRPPPGPQPSGVPRLEDEVVAILLVDFATAPVEVERIATFPLLRSLGVHRASFRSFDVAGKEARDAGYTRDWARRVGAPFGVSDLPAIIYFRVTGPGRGDVVYVEEATTGKRVVDVILEMRGKAGASQ